MATIRLIPSAYTFSNTSYVTTNSSYPMSNAYANTDSTTEARATHNRSQNTTYYVYLHNFNFNDIPSNAVVSSFTVKIKIAHSNLSTSSSYRMSLYNGSTSISNTTCASSWTTSAATYTFPNGSLNWETLSGYGNNFRIRIPLRRSSSSTSGYARIYGAEILVNYTVPTLHTITASSSVTGVTATPATQSILEGDSATITFNCNDISNYVVTDNGVDVTSSCVRHSAASSNSISAVPGSNVTTGHYRSGGAFYQSSSTSSDAWLRYAIGYSAESPYSTSNTSNTYSKDGTNDANTQSWMNYPFDFSDIPSNAIIDSVEVKCYGAIESTSQSSRHADVSLWSGSTQKGTTQQFTSTNNYVMTIDDVGTWTRAELQNATLRFGVGYYGGRLLGVTWTVEYTVPGNGYYYTYTIPNVVTGHAVIIEESNSGYVPPVEDPTKTYYPVTISSINATTDPSSGTTRVEAGDDLSVSITPSDPQLTLALDNGIDITDQLTGGQPNNTYTVTPQVSGASYGFNLNSSTGYYTSTNNGVANSAAVCRINFSCETACLVTIQYINYAEATYDYGIFGRVDTALGTTYTADSNPYLSCGTSTYNTSSVQTLTYDLTAGDHYIDIKYRKDTATNSNNDNLQWKISSIEATGTSGNYTYNLTDINEKHSLIFVFGDVSFYYITSSTSAGARLFPEGQMVKIQGDEYKLVIIPDDNSSTITLRDNGTNVTSSLSTLQVTDGNNNTITEYVYQLNNINANHNLIVSIDGATIQLYIKQNGSWVAYSTAYKKINGSWVEMGDLTSIFNATTNYRKGN